MKNRHISESPSHNASVCVEIIMGTSMANRKPGYKNDSKSEYQAGTPNYSNICDKSVYSFCHFTCVF